jgi:hypothetical protein
MRLLIGPCVLALGLVVFTAGCGSEPNPRAVNVKQDTRLKRVGEGTPEQGKPNQNNQALP